MNKPAVLKILVEYFSEKGKILSVPEYKAAEDAPMRFIVAKRAFGSWARMTQMAKKQMLDITPATVEVPKAKAPKAKAAPKKAEK
jgi:hypothetical protein